MSFRISGLRLKVSVPIIEPHIPMQCILLNRPMVKATIVDVVKARSKSIVSSEYLE